MFLQFPIAPLLPQSINQTYFRSKSAKSSSSYVLDDGQLFLPRTFVTRKGAILLFTPSDDLCNHGNGESHLKKQDVYEAGLKLRTLGNLTNSVLEFGKEVSLSFSIVKTSLIHQCEPVLIIPRFHVECGQYNKNSQWPMAMLVV